MFVVSLGQVIRELNATDVKLCDDGKVIQFVGVTGERRVWMFNEERGGDENLLTFTY